MRATHLDYQDIERQTKALTNRMRAFIMAHPACHRHRQEDLRDAAT